MKKYDVIIFGAGIAGLTCAYYLSKKYKVLVLEKSNKSGGVLESISRCNFNIEVFYHHVFKRDKDFIKLVKDLNLEHKLMWNEAPSAFLYNDNFYELSKPIDLLWFKPLNFIDKLQLFFLMARLKLTRDMRRADKYSAREWIIKYGSKEIFSKFFEPLLYGKYGSNMDSISAAWFIERINLRSSIGSMGEILGYVNGGFQNVINKLEGEIKKNGGKILHNISPKRIYVKNKYASAVEYDRVKIETKCVVSTIPPKTLSSIASFPSQYKEKIRNLEYQGSICVLLALRNPLTRYYWTNIVRKKKGIFGAIIEHTNYIPKKEYDNKNIVYLGSYPSLKSDLWKLSDKEIFKLYFSELKQLFPNINKKDVMWMHVAKAKDAGLVYKKGILEQILPLETPIKNIYIGGMFNSYPERGINESIRLGKKIANLVIERHEKN